ncbi:hypothetical protein FRC10_009184 [Ceratobasidium sp. 414]|nr:hypothetical protein FRC10_009184 [Ceratobasidium sp. 414]
MIALRLLLGKTGTSSSCTYETKSAVEQDRLDRRSPAPPSNEAEYKLQKALDENTLQASTPLSARLLLALTEPTSSLAAQSAYILAQQQEQERQLPPKEYTARIAQLEARLTETESQLAASITARAQAKAHIAALQHQRAQLVLELEQMEDGFQTELSKVSGELSSWERDMIRMNGRPKDSDTATTSPPPSQPHSRSSSSTSSPPRAAAALTASLERAKSATRIWALEDEVDRVRHERDALRRRLVTGRANLMQLKRQASEVQVRLGRGRERGLNKSESNLLKGLGLGMGMGMSTRASDMHLNTRVRPVMRGEPLTPETSDDSRSIEMNM